MEGIERFWPEWLEALLVVAALLMADRKWGWWGRALESAGRALDGIARRRALAILLAGVFPVAVRVGLLDVMSIPEPAIHDEYSYLLSADTFAHGRLANPPQAMWEHLETFHVLQHPTYASMEPPGPGLFLAAGQVVFGHPWFGVCLSMGLLCAAICWMLQQWFSAGWALAGALLAGVRWGILSYWTNSYWGGAVAAIGGVLVLGACGAILNARRPRAALVLGVGWCLLVVSRPAEGLLMSIPVVICLAPRWRRVALPAGAVLALGLACLGYYNWRVTGKPWVLPHQLNRAEYAVVPYFLWQQERPAPVYRHEAMRDFYVHFEAGFAQQTKAHPWRRIAQMLQSYWRFFLGPALTIPFAAGIWSVRGDPRLRVVVAALLAPWLSHLITASGLLLHYEAPCLGALLILVVAGLRGFGSVSFSRTVPLICVAMLVVAICAWPLDALPKSVPYYAWYTKSYGNAERAAILNDLASRGGKHLVIVQYLPGHDPIQEWVFNTADLDRTAVVWARDMGAEKNAELIRYFADRTAWMVAPDQDALGLKPYPHR